MPTPESRFARALAEYLEHHSQQELSGQCGADRSVLSGIITGRRPPARGAALSIIAGIPDRSERRILLREWLEDNIPANCTDLLRITTSIAEPAPHPSTEKDRAIAWLLHQLDVNIHAVHTIVDLFRAAGSPSVPVPANTSPAPDGDPTTGHSTKILSYADHIGPDQPARIAEPLNERRLPSVAASALTKIGSKATTRLMLASSR